MIFNEFLEKQEKIYAEFRDTSKVEAEGLASQISNNKGGYIFALRHSKNIIDGIESLTEKISQIISSIKYDQNNIHTTLSTYQVMEEFQPVDRTLECLSNIMRCNLSLFKGVEIEYNEYLMNQDSAIIAGMPNLHFFQGAQGIIEQAQEHGIQLKSPWGAHITISRFLEELPHEQVLELLGILKNSKSLGISKPKHIDVGYFILTPKDFKINVYERFQL